MEGGEAEHNSDNNRKLQKKERIQIFPHRHCPAFFQKPLSNFIKAEFAATVLSRIERQLRSQMPSRRAIDVRAGDGNSQKWRVSLSEDAFDSFVAHGVDAARKVFGEGSLFSPLLFGKFFDPGDAFPLWEFEADALLAGLRSASKTGVDWFETDSEYVLKAELPVGARRCDAEVCGPNAKVIEISGLWRGKESEMREWKMGRWWENGFVRRLELPADANWKKIEACIVDDALLEIKIPKNTPDGNPH